MKLFHSALSNTRAALDLASIMVGVVVIGIVGGVIAATVFSVIPWAQNNAAKATLGSIQTAQSAAVGLSGTAPGYKTVEYLQGTNPQNTVFLPDTGNFTVALGTNANCYLAVTLSETGDIFYNTNLNPTPKQYSADSANNNGCVGSDLNLAVNSLG